jgi:hypothetical protein
VRQAFVRDIRTPADPQDFESLYDRPARPPRDFRVTTDGVSTMTFLFQDFSGIPERESTVGYRAYHVPASVATAAEMGQLARRRAALRLGRLVAEVSASGRGEWIRLASSDFPTATGGFYIAVGINRRGVESDPTLAYASPY